MGTCRVSSIPGRSAGTRNIVAPPSVLAITMKKPAPSAPVMNFLRPVSDQPLSVALAVVRNALGSDPAPGGGSVIANAERCSPLASGAR
ncbi:hypothetical protein Afe04nite_54980 [Asanoa ferruginea]|nr:hypothetical protein Afe04nite_54980 [Asanoa ferruginea]